jgi:hypothetical protein
VYSSNGDNYEAEKLLLEAEQILDSIMSDPSGSELAEALTQSLQSIMQGQHTGAVTDTDRLMKLRLYPETARLSKMWAQAS